MDEDSDDGGVRDGDEDDNRDGIKDADETDPFDRTDDLPKVKITIEPESPVKEGAITVEVKCLEDDGTSSQPLIKALPFSASTSRLKP